MAPLTVKVKHNGPYFIALEDADQLHLVDHNGDPIAPPPGRGIVLCRCGSSSTKPFCDGTHKRIGFQGSQEPTAATPETGGTVA